MNDTEQLRKLEAAIPKVNPVPEGVKRPLWSVMIPTYNCAHYLKQTLESVLAQDPGLDQMQIEVVDDCSTKDDPEAVVREIGKGRVLFYRQSKNVGPPKNFNTCIERSRGHLVHILHGDDYVLPEFYKILESEAACNKNIAMLMTRSFWVDKHGDILFLSPRIKTSEEGIIQLSEIFYTNPVTTPSVVIKREFYESFGGFCEELIHTADWEMWMRAIAKRNGIFVNTPNACYRHFDANHSSKLLMTGENLRDYQRAQKLFQKYSTRFDRNRFRQLILKMSEMQMNHQKTVNNKEGVRANAAVWRESFRFSTCLKEMLGAVKRSAQQLALRLFDRV